MTVKLLIEHNFEFLSLKGGCTCSSESTHIKIPHCWESHVTVHLSIQNLISPLSVNIDVGTGTSSFDKRVKLSMSRELAYKPVALV